MAKVRSTLGLGVTVTITAHHLMAANKDKVEKIADEIVARREIYGDDLVALLDRQQLQAPEIDYEDEKAWPRI